MATKAVKATKAAKAARRFLAEVGDSSAKRHVARRDRPTTAQ
jgi:hypothetical protein